jgi:hypothetical protein
MTIVCPSCPAGATPQLLEIEASYNEVRCPTCRKRFRVVTRKVHETRSHQLTASKTRYTLITYESEGRRTRPRIIEAQPSLQLSSGAWLTLVYRGERLVGIADQTSSFWYPVPTFPSSHTSMQRLMRILTWTVLALALLQLTRLVPALGDTLSKPSGIIVLLLTVLLILAPAILFTVQTLGIGQQKRYLPKSSSQMDDPFA